MLGIVAMLAGAVLAPPTLAAGLYWLTATDLGWPAPSFGLFAAMVAGWAAVLAGAIVIYER